MLTLLNYPTEDWLPPGFKTIDLQQSQCGGTLMLTLLNYPTEDWPKPTYYHLDSKIMADKKLY